jgi:hypothetical protein
MNSLRGNQVRDSSKLGAPKIKEVDNLNINRMNTNFG